ncbi:MAG: hypothetical protein IPP56_07980 [Bacteroidetes bacterium]|nr:hypothetical protein [Bacteroidota bacterium]
MKKTTQSILVALTLLLATIQFNSAYAQGQGAAGRKADRDTRAWRYEVQCVGVGTDGTKLIKVFSYSKKADVAIEQAKKNAVHAMIFQGFVGNSGSGCPTQKPLTNNPGLEQEKIEFFDSFFADGGKYMKFVTVSGDGAVAAQDRMKVGKEYKIVVVVSVMYDQLRKDLEAAGIIRGLSSGF